MNKKDALLILRVISNLETAIALHGIREYPDWENVKKANEILTDIILSEVKDE